VVGYLAWERAREPASPSAGDRFRNSIGMDLVWIEPGTFMMGSPEEEVERDGDEVQHEVTLTKGFYLGVMEVTRGQFARFVEATGYVTEAETEGSAWTWDGKDWNDVQGASWRSPGFEQGDDHPVVCVSWNDAKMFCDWLTTNDPRWSYRLPTESEWEYACRAGTKTTFAWGDDPAEAQVWCNLADKTLVQEAPTWPYGSAAGQDGSAFTAPVGTYGANAWGLRDMHGNAWEWCADWYGDYPAEAVVDPAGPVGGSGRVLRGGSWLIDPRSCRSAFRYWLEPGYRDCCFGFRVLAVAGRQ
jgi:formylglycine-generating enzyme required for sulfatase activity